MQAVFFNEHGAVEVLTYGELPDPAPAAHEVLVRVRACGLNHADVWVRKGLPMLRVPFPFVLGQDIGGEVVAVGSEVGSVRAGDRVTLNPGVSCGVCELCLGGRDHYCPQFNIIGKNLPGGYAELVKAPAQNIVPLPDELTWEQAACIPVVFITAWNMLFDRARLQPGEWVLVHAGGSGVGTAAIQLARMIGATVITTASSEEKLEKAAELGADHLINYKKQDFLREVRKLTKKRGVDVVIEHVGVDVWESSLLCLATGGRLVTCGASSGFQATTNLRHVFFRNLEILGATAGSKSHLHKIVKLVAQGKLKPVLDRALPLRDAREAHSLMEGHRQFGKLLLIPEHGG